MLSVVLADGKIKAADLKQRIKELKKDKSGAEELDVLEKYSQLLDNEYTYNKAIRALKEDLDIALKRKYKKLSIEEIKYLIVNLKWSFDIFAGIDAIYTSVSHHLANRITELAERYESTLAEYTNEVVQYESKVKSHLERMGFKW